MSESDDGVIDRVRAAKHGADEDRRITGLKVMVFGLHLAFAGRHLTESAVLVVVGLCFGLVGLFFR